MHLSWMPLRYHPFTDHYHRLHRIIFVTLGYHNKKQHSHENLDHLWDH